MKISDQTVVLFEYTLRDDAGQVIDSSEGRDPMAYLHGSGQIVPGLERQLTGRSAGENLQVTVSPDEGYGERLEQLVGSVPRDRFKGVQSIEPGMHFTANTQSGPRDIVVTDVSDTEVTIDANHPLAGQTLHFEIGIIDVRAATAEELDHGHAHSHQHNECCGGGHGHGHCHNHDHDHEHEHAHDHAHGHAHEHGECCGGKGQGQCQNQDHGHKH